MKNNNFSMIILNFDLPNFLKVSKLIFVSNMQCIVHFSSVKYGMFFEINFFVTLNIPTCFIVLSLVMPASANRTYSFGRNFLVNQSMQ